VATIKVRKIGEDAGSTDGVDGSRMMHVLQIMDVDGFTHVIRVEKRRPIREQIVEFLRGLNDVLTYEI